MTDQEISSPLLWAIATSVLLTVVAYRIVVSDKKKPRVEYWQTIQKLGAKPTKRTAAAVDRKDRKYTFFDDVEFCDGMALIRFNGPGKVNTISKPMIEEAQRIFHEAILPNKETKAVIFISSKRDNFIAGADIDALQAVEDKSLLADMCSKGHAFFDYLKATKLPIVAAIDGSTLGGGLEWAMHCDYRIATNSKKSQFGLPEVKLGLLPGLGGTYLLTKLVGLTQSLDMILTGRSIKVEQAKSMGLIDLVVSPEDLETAAILQTQGIITGAVKLRLNRRRTWLQWLLEENPLGRYIMFYKAKAQVDKSTGGHYPAPYAILKLLEKSHTHSRQEWLLAEAQAFAKLAATKESEALFGVFFSSSEVKKHEFGVPQTSVKTIAVYGTNDKSAGIAQISLDPGEYSVLLKGGDDGYDGGAAVAQTKQTVISALEKKLKQKRMGQADFDRILSHLTVISNDLSNSTDSMGAVVTASNSNSSSNSTLFLATADIVFECSPDDLAVKQKAIHEIESLSLSSQITANTCCIIATTTSSEFSVRNIAESAKRPERVIGIHYSDPLAPFVEIVIHRSTSAEVAATAMEVVLKQGKTAIIVQDSPGFFANRCLVAMLAEALVLVREGVCYSDVDKAMRAYGFAAGPFAMCDEIGLDVICSVFNSLIQSDTDTPPTTALATGSHNRLRDQASYFTPLEDLVQTNMLGKSTGGGFYLYKADGKQKGGKINSNPAATKALLMSISSTADVTATATTTATDAPSADAAVADSSPSSSSKSRVLLRSPKRADYANKDTSRSKNEVGDADNNEVRGSVLSAAPRMKKEEIQQRLVARLVNEVAYCLQEGVIRSPADGDIGAVYGLGFPPFLGGPFRMLDIYGIKPFFDRLSGYNDKFGSRYEPALILRDFAASGVKFHGTVGRELFAVAAATSAAARLTSIY